MELPTKQRRSRPWLFSLCVLAAFTVFSVAALAMPRPQSAESLERAYADLSGSREPVRGGGMVVAEGDERSSFGSHDSGREHGARSRIKGMFIKKATVCLVSQTQMELLQQVFHIQWKTVVIHGVETKVMIIHGVRSHRLLKKLGGMLGELDCRTVPLHVSWIIFIFNPHLS